MVAKKTPTALRVVRGMDKKNPSRRNDSEPAIVLGIGKCPGHLSPDHAAIWDEIVAMSYEGVLGEADRIGLEVLCVLICRFRKSMIDSSVESLTAAEVGQVTRLLSCYGMTPSDRSKIVVPKKKDTNSFADL